MDRHVKITIYDQGIHLRGPQSSERDDGPSGILFFLRNHDKFDEYVKIFASSLKESSC